MTDVATAGAPVTPAPAGTTGEPGSGTTQASPAAPATEELQHPLSRHDAQTALLERLRTKSEAPQPEAPKPEETPAPTTTPPPEAGTTIPTPEAAAPAAPGVKVDIPADHPIASGKPQSITVQSEDEARMLRGLVNATGVRVREAQAYRERAREAEARALEAQRKLARVETNMTARQKWEASEDGQKARTIYDAIKQEHGPEEAERYWRGKTKELEDQVDQEYQTRDQQIRAEADERNAVDWKREAFLRLGPDSALPLPAIILNQPKFTDWFEIAVESFNDALKRGHVIDETTGLPLQDPRIPRDRAIELSHQAFREHFTAYAVSRPEVRKAYAEGKARQEAVDKAATDKAAAEKKREEEIAAKAVEDYKKSLGADRQVRPPNPLGLIPNAARPPVPSGSGAEIDTSASQTPGQAKRAALSGLLDRYRGRRP